MRSRSGKSGNDVEVGKPGNEVKKSPIIRLRTGNSGNEVEVR
jgi:hypothetical protein